MFVPLFKSIMGISERREREKEEMKELILKTANKLFAEHGFDKVSMRNIADAIEYSPTTIYLYFKDKNELFYALHLEGFRMLAYEFRPLLEVKDPMERMYQMGLRYIRFAIENPDYYQLMFLVKDPLCTTETDETWEAGHNAHAFLEQVVIECQEQGYLQGITMRAAALMIWSFVHGLVSLQICDRMKLYQEVEREQYITDAYEAFQLMIRNFKSVEK
ncbi:TetR/AcrR family transcriptional regulator [Imperialibacter roseus]|uniref:TetR/AcrR family transcriptional regulator n=2 Tax=Imperialibacter TaxID=1649461 RepID=A0ABZ0IVR3_9BACT|nr:TetR/AcrR family transcriptional regulator [Imperialibacter roseus]WOK08607.1 TetR/AcrR family transcriptional regulator [Imperialibacter roseus]